VTPLTATQRKSEQALHFLGALLLVVIAGMLAYARVIHVEALYGYWIVTYFIVALVILRQLSRGLLHHPVVLAGAGYFLLLIAGSLSYSFFKERSLNAYTFNLVGIGFSALMGGILLGCAFGPPARAIAFKPNIFNVPVLYGLALVAVGCSLFMFVKFHGLPILAANPNDAKVNFLSQNGLLNLFFKGLPVFSLALLFVHYHSGRPLWPVHSYAVLMMLIILAAGYRSTALISLGEYVVLYLLLTQTRISMKAIATAGVLVIVFLTFWGSFRRGSEGAEGMWRELDIVINARPVIFETIVRNFDTGDFFYGSLYYSDFKRFQPGVQVNANVDLKYALFGNAEAMPDVAGITPSMPGEAYMNFGHRGVFWVLLAVGILLGLFYRRFHSKPDFFYTAMYLTFVFSMTDAIQTGIGLKLVHLVQFWVWCIFLGIVFEINFKRKPSMLSSSTTL
jgi:oligosaccharide repeat unit polymerase